MPPACLHTGCAQDLEAIDPELYRSLLWILAHPIADSYLAGDLTVSHESLALLCASCRPEGSLYKTIHISRLWEARLCRLFIPARASYAEGQY